MRTRRRAAIVVAAGLVVTGCSFGGRSDVTRELDDIMEAVGVEDDDAYSYGGTMESKQPEEGCEGVGSGDRTSRFRKASVRRTALTPDQIVDRLIRHYEGGAGEMRLFEATGESDVAFTFTMLDLERHRVVFVTILTDGGFAAQVAATACPMDDYAEDVEQPEIPSRQIPLPR